MNLPKEFTVWSIMRYAPPFPFLEEQYHGKQVLVLVGCYNGPLEEGERYFSEIKKLGVPLGDGVAAQPFQSFQKAFDSLLTPGLRNYWKSHNFKNVSNELIDVLVAYSQQLPSKLSEVFLARMGGAINEIASDTTAYPHRDIEFVLNVHTRWEEKAQDDACITWARELFKATKPFATGGVYLNFISEGDDNVESAFAENSQRLAAVKSTYDKKNVLCMSLKVTPEDNS